MFHLIKSENTIQKSYAVLKAVCGMYHGLNLIDTETVVYWHDFLIFRCKNLWYYCMRMLFQQLTEDLISVSPNEFSTESSHEAITVGNSFTSFMNLFRSRVAHSNEMLQIYCDVSYHIPNGPHTYKTIKLAIFMQEPLLLVLMDRTIRQQWAYICILHFTLQSQSFPKYVSLLIECIVSENVI
jgi:hypothetical protein